MTFLWVFLHQLFLSLWLLEAICTHLAYVSFVSCPWQVHSFECHHYIIYLVLLSYTVHMEFFLSMTVIHSTDLSIPLCGLFNFLLKTWSTFIYLIHIMAGRGHWLKPCYSRHNALSVCHLVFQKHSNQVVWAFYIFGALELCPCNLAQVYPIIYCF